MMGHKYLLKEDILEHYYLYISSSAHSIAWGIWDAEPFIIKNPVANIFLYEF